MQIIYTYRYINFLVTRMYTFCTSTASSSIVVASSRNEFNQKCSITLEYLRRWLSSYVLTLKVLVDIHKQSKAEVKDEDDDKGGINLMQAKQRMEEEDKFDKQLYREKIKARHRVRIGFIYRCNQIVKSIFNMLTDITLFNCMYDVIIHELFMFYRKSG